MEAINKIKKALRKRFKMKDLGEAKVILGLEISRDKTLGTIKLSQGKYTGQVLEKFGRAECNPIATPFEVGPQLAKSEKSDESGTSRFEADFLLDKYFKGGQLSGGVKQGGVLERHAQRRCKPCCCKKQNSRNQVLTGFEPQTPRRDPKVTPNESRCLTSH